MCVLTWSSTKTGSTCRTNLVLAVTVGTETVVWSSCGMFGRSGVTLGTRCSNTITPSAHRRIFQSAFKPAAVVHALQAAHHLIVMSPLSVVGESRFQIQLGS